MTHKKQVTNIHGNVEKMIQIEKVDGDVVINPPSATITELFEQGKKLLKVRAYVQSISSFEKAIAIDPNLDDINFYLAIALLRGNRPKLVNLSTIKSIENCLKTAIQLQPKLGCAYVLWALVKYDFYVLNGMYDRPPSYQDLLNGAWSIRHSQIQEILSLINAVDNPVWQWLKNQS